jgi:hypothetical protein
VAQERLQIRLDAIDNTKRAFNGLKSNTDNAKTALLSLRNVLVGLGAGLAVRSVVNVGKQIESLGLRFKFLFGTAKEGTKAFNTLVNFASRVPFTLEQIQAGAGNLAVVTKDAEELGNILEIVGNVASVTGLDFQQTAEQIQRSFSGGIASADVFRERGVNALLGFRAGATVSIEETRKRFQDVFGKGGKFGNATNEFANTLEGTLSMLQDKLFKFQTVISNQFFEVLKERFGDLNKFLDQNEGSIDKLGKAIGTFTASAISNLSKALIYLTENVRTLEMAFGSLIFLISNSVLGKVVGGIIAINGALKELDQQMGKLVRGIRDFSEKLLAVPLQKIVVFYDDLEESIVTTTDKLATLTKGTEEYNKVLKEHEAFLLKGIQDETARQEALVKSKYEQEQLTQAVKEYQEAFKASFGGTLAGELQASLDKMKTAFDSIYLTISQGIVGGIRSLSESIAEAIVLGKGLGDAFKNFVLKGILSALAGIIQFYLTKLLVYALEKLFGIVIQDQVDLEQKKLSVLKKQTSELQKQLALRAIMSFFGGGFAEGGFLKGGGRAEGGRVQGYRANGGQTSRTNAYMVGERGRELFIPSTDGQIVSNEKLGGLGSTNISFTVQATDVKGVKELLIDNRATITNIINSALNQKGKPALI